MNEPTLPSLPDPGPGRYWWGVHAPNSVKTPLTLELREQTNAGPIVPSFSRLIAKQPTIADEKAIIEAANEILVRAQSVDRYVGVLGEGRKESK